LGEKEIVPSLPTRGRERKRNPPTRRCERKKKKKRVLKKGEIFPPIYTPQKGGTTALILV